jgi:hypothetical protein
MAGVTNLDEIILNYEDKQKSKYHLPEIIIELELEVNTGSPVDIDPLDMFNEGQ